MPEVRRELPGARHLRSCACLWFRSTGPPVYPVGQVFNVPTSCLNCVDPASRTFDADVICSHAALCSCVDALTCCAAAAWPSAVLAIDSRLTAAWLTAEAFAS